MTTETTKEELEWAFTNYKPNQRMVYSYVDRLYKKGKGIHINPNLPPNQKILIPKKGVGSYLVVLAKEDDEQGSEHENGIPEPSSPIPINDESRNDSHSDGSPKHSKTDKPKKQTKQNNSQQTSRSYSNEILTLKSAFLNGFKLMNIPKDEESDFGEDLSQLLEYVFDDQINMVQVTNCRSIVGKYELINSVTSSTVAHLNYILCKARRAYKAKLVKNKVANNRYEIQQLLDANVDGISNTLQAKEYIIALDKKVCKGAKIVDLVDLLFLGSKGTQILLLLVWKTSIPWSTFYNLCNEKISLLIECITEDVAAHTRIQAISKSPHDKDNDKGYNST